MTDCLEHGARSELVLRWAEMQKRVSAGHADDPSLIEAMELLRLAINQYFQAIGWVADELPPVRASMK